MDFEQGYRLTRQAWIDGVKAFHPTPKEAYILPWEKMSSWEQEAVKALYQHVRNIILPGLKEDIRISPEHGGYLVCSIWNVLMFQLLRDPKPSYVKHFNELDEWQQKTDIKMFEAIEATVLQEISLQR
ncbi:MAG: hypothetical protein H0W02_01515 [Ktedonobacteraceae bacterium]|nr:hypothetical protein [Ktedonobacteraceae bacterium]